MKKYFTKLTEQYKKATGDENIDPTSLDFLSEFDDFILERQRILREYQEFICEMFPYSEENCVEVGKGFLDSIAIDTNIQMITPYIAGINQSKQKVINANFKVTDGNPYIFKRTMGKYNIRSVNPNICHFITQNPYSISNISNWDQLHNNKDMITVGVYGSTFDKDVNSKLEQLKHLKEKLMDDTYYEYYVTEDDMYCYAISSKPKTLKKK